MYHTEPIKQHHSSTIKTETLSRDTRIKLLISAGHTEPCQELFPFLDVFTYLRWSDYLKDHFLSLLL